VPAFSATISPLPFPDINAAAADAQQRFEQLKAQQLAASADARATATATASASAVGRRLQGAHMEIVDVAAAGVLPKQRRKWLGMA
jgi:cytochrome c1